MKSCACFVLRLTLCLAVTVSLSAFLTACEDDDDASEPAPEAQEGQEDQEEAEEDQEEAEEDQEEAEEDQEEAEEEQLVTVAPQLVSPENDKTFKEESGLKIVEFEWTAVPNAASYVFELTAPNGKVDKYTLGPATKFKPVIPFATGTWSWRVWGHDANGNAGPSSQKWFFRVQEQAP